MVSTVLKSMLARLKGFVTRAQCKALLPFSGVGQARSLRQGVLSAVLKKVSVPLARILTTVRPLASVVARVQPTWESAIV